MKVTSVNEELGKGLLNTSSGIYFSAESFIHTYTSLVKHQREHFEEYLNPSVPWLFEAMSTISCHSSGGR